MASTNLEKQITKAVPVVDYKGVKFADIAGVFGNPVILRKVVKEFAQQVRTAAEKANVPITFVAGLDARGFPLAALLANELYDEGARFVMFRKPGKLPSETYRVEYGKEYGTDTIEVQKNSLGPDDHGVIIDDILASGGTLSAASKLVELATGRRPLLALTVMNIGAVPIEEIVIKLSCPSFSITGPSSPLGADPTVQRLYLQEVAPSDKRLVVLSCLTFESNAKRFADSLPNSRRFSPISWKRFPDGTPNVEFAPLEAYSGRHLVFFMDLTDTTTLLEQLSVCMAINRQLPASLTLFAPFLPTATMERVDKAGVLATAETLAKLISSSFAANPGGLPRIVIFDIHATPVRFYFDESKVTVIPRSFIETFAKKHLSEHGITAVAFPDDGAAKRFGAIFKPLCPIIVFAKHRGEGAERTLQENERIGFVNGLNDEAGISHVLIVDDLLQTGINGL